MFYHLDKISVSFSFFRLIYLLLYYLLSESNAELNEELSFLRSRLESLEGSLQREEEVKMATVEDIGKQAKVFKKLVTQLAVERERLKQQVKIKIEKFYLR